MILRGYLIAIDKNIPVEYTHEVAEIAWVNMQNYTDYLLTPQIVDLILPKLKEFDLID